jgi:hypothetical protein
VILSTFGEEIQQFVRQGEDLAAQMDRLKIADLGQQIMEAAPELFQGKTLTDFLNVVSAFGEEMGSITAGFEEVVRLVEIVGSTLATLQDFVDSDLAADYAALSTGQGSLTDILAGMNSELMDAVTNFDGSIESLSEIGMMSMAIREGELALLQQIDSIQQGLNSNLEKLKADILGLTEVEQTGKEILDRAAGLAFMVGRAETPEEVARIGQEFDALVRSMSPEDQLRYQSELLQLIESFGARSSENLGDQRQNVIDNAEQTRQFLDGWLESLGTTLDIIAGSNERVATVLENDAEMDSLEEPLGGIMDDGLTDISLAVESIGPKVARAVRSAVAGVDVNVIINAQPGGLVTE